MISLVYTNVIAQKSGATKSKPASKKEAVSVSADSICGIFSAIVEKVSSKKLQSIMGASTSSNYYSSFNIYKATLGFPEAVDCFIENDPSFSKSYHAFVKNYGDDEAGAKVDFDLYVKRLTDCLSNEKVSKGSALDTYIFYKKCRIEVHTFYSGNVDAWVLSVTIEESN